MPDELTIRANVGPLTRLGELLDQEVTKALEQLAAETVADAKGRAPVKTGFLRDSISGTVGGPGLTVVAAAEYAGYVEFGTRHNTARPFLTPAVDQAKGRLPDLVAEAFREAARRAV
jgi:HK97 gp10 family phage protein